MTFWYEDYNDDIKKVIEYDVLDFIGKITQHIASKGFRMVWRYGVYLRINNKLAKDIVHLGEKKVEEGSYFVDEDEPMPS